jgi:hypothetical protein
MVMGRKWKSAPDKQKLREANMIKRLAVSVLMFGSTLAFAQPYRRDFRYNERPVVGGAPPASRAVRRILRPARLLTL